MTNTTSLNNAMAQFLEPIVTAAKAQAALDFDTAMRSVKERAARRLRQDVAKWAAEVFSHVTVETNGYRITVTFDLEDKVFALADRDMLMKTLGMKP